MNELRETVGRILALFEKKSKYDLAKELADVLCLSDTADLQFKIEEILDRQLSPEETFAVNTLELILRDYDLFLDFEQADPAEKGSAC